MGVGSTIIINLAAITVTIINILITGFTEIAHAEWAPRALLC